ncbi:MAG: single-stranded-DNA-specific exonuclease RecJ [Elusimicrobiota bacterium]
MKKWEIKSVDKLLIDELAQKTGYSKILISILVQKGIKTVSELKKFIKPHLTDLYNPFLFKDMEKAVNRIRKAIDSREKILIYGDRDVDGITSTNIAVSYLTELNADVRWYIPSEEGYGLHKEIIEKYRNENVSLIITVDCGISGVSEVEFAKSIGIDVIITDHHEPPPSSELPNAFCVIDPKSANEQYPFKELAGCGVSFKLFQALAFSYSRYFAKDIVVLDIETTGLSPLMDEIVEIGAVKIRNFVQIGTFSTLVKPHSHIPKSISAIHGITDEDCKDAPDITEVIKKFLVFLGDAIIVAHNANFDTAFLYLAARKIKEEIPNEVIDTLEISRALFPFRSHGLDALAKDLDVEIKNYHRALSDAIVTAEIFEHLVLMQEKKQQRFIENYIYLVALGTIADIVPLVNENRVFVKYGIPMLYNSQKPGIYTIVKNLQIEKKSFTAKKISWSIVPFLNAAGRYGKADLSFELLNTADKNRANKLFDEILDINNKRKNLQKINIRSFIDETIKQNDIETDKIFVTVVDNLQHGVTGIAANQILREFGKPVILLILENNEAIGAARSIEGFDIVSAIEKCKDIVVKYGGHKKAAGLTVVKNNLDEFIRRIKFIANSLITDEILVPKLLIDCEISASEISVELIKELELLEPCGFGNDYPVFILNDIVLSEFSSVGIDGAHLRTRFKDDKIGIGGIGWQLGRRAADFKKGQKVNVAFQLEINVWQTKESAQLKILDLKPSDGIF